MIMGIASTSSPNIVNGDNRIHFSHESGFYDDGFDLTLSSSSGTIYYTLDGSDPDSNSILYEDKITISDASLNENVYSMRTDVSTGFLTDLIEQYSSDDPEYKVPDYLIDKCTVVRAVVSYGNDSYSDIVTKVYFVGYDAKSGYDTVNIISIVTDPVNLFDYEDGIYVTGSVFDNTDRNEAWMESFVAPYWWWWTSNYSKGQVAEKQVSCQFFVNRKLVLSQDCGLKIHGGGSRGKNPKSLNLYARADYGGYGYFEYNFWDTSYYPESMTLFQGGDDDASKLQDYFMAKVCEKLDFATMDMTPYVMFLDGEYWGVYWLTEKYDEAYLSYHYDIQEDNSVIIKNAALEKGEESDMDLYNEMMDFCSNADLEDEENYNRLTELIDIDSFIDYFAAMLYIGRCSDWPGGNTAMWRSRKIGNGKYDDGRWRWMLFDVNSGGLTEDLINFDSYGNAMNNAFFLNMMSNDTIRNRLLDRIAELRDSIFSYESVHEQLEVFHRIMDDPMVTYCRRFWGEDSYFKYTDKVSSVEKFLYERSDYIDEMIAAYR
jgi:hypothetical protein